MDTNLIMPFSHTAAFRHAPFLWSGHAQTLAGWLLRHPMAPVPEMTQRHVVTLEDGDAIVLHEDQGVSWRPADRVVLMIHGLAGSCESGYMRRTAARLNSQGIRTFRMEMRGCGAARTLARFPTHSGRSGDVLAAMAQVKELAPGSPITLFGFSLGGNMVLNTLAEIGAKNDTPLDMSVVVCPPIDLMACSSGLRAKRLRLYDRYFIRALLKTLQERNQLFPDSPQVNLKRKPDSLWEFDDLVTAPLCNFASAEAYYRATSPAPRLLEIRVPTLIVAAANDPLVPSSMFKQVRRSSAVSLLMTNGGGHLGFLARRGVDPDERWLDWRLVEWTLAADGRKLTAG